MRWLGATDPEFDCTTATCTRLSFNIISLNRVDDKENKSHVRWPTVRFRSLRTRLLMIKVRSFGKTYVDVAYFSRLLQQ
jgi:hypothetical protein